MCPVPLLDLDLDPGTVGRPESLACYADPVPFRADQRSSLLGLAIWLVGGEDPEKRLPIVLLVPLEAVPLPSREFLVPHNDSLFRRCRSDGLAGLENFFSPLLPGNLRVLLPAVSSPVSWTDSQKRYAAPCSFQPLCHRRDTSSLIHLGSR